MATSTAAPSYSARHSGSAEVPPLICLSVDGIPYSSIQRTRTPTDAGRLTAAIESFARQLRLDQPLLVAAPHGSRDGRLDDRGRVASLDLVSDLQIGRASPAQS